MPECVTAKYPIVKSEPIAIYNIFFLSLSIWPMLNTHTALVNIISILSSNCHSCSWICIWINRDDVIALWFMLEFFNER